MRARMGHGASLQQQGQPKKNDLHRAVAPSSVMGPPWTGLKHLQRGKTRKNDPKYAWTLKKKTRPTSGSFPHMLKVVFCARAASGYLRPQPAFPPLQQEGTTLLFIGVHWRSAHRCVRLSPPRAPHPRLLLPSSQTIVKVTIWCSFGVIKLYTCT